MSKDDIYNALNLSAPIEDVEIVEGEQLNTVEVIEQSNTAVDTDFEDGRKQIHRVLEMADEVIEEIGNIAMRSQDTEAFDSFANIFSKIVDARHKLMDMHIKKSKVDQTVNDSKTGKGGNTTNNLFIGSTTELAKYLNARSDDNE